MDITGHTVEQLKDPTGILEGERFEFLLNIDVDEEDELFSDQGLTLRVIVAVTEGESRITQYHFIENNTNKYLDFGLEEDEEDMVIAYCRQHTLLD